MSVWIQRAIGERLAHLRGAESRQSFAQRHGYNRLVYGRMEAGRQNLTLGTLVGFAGIHGLTLAKLLEGAEARAAELEAEDASAS